MKLGFDAENFFKVSIHIIVFGLIVTWLIPELTFGAIWPCMFGYCLGQAVANIGRKAD